MTIRQIVKDYDDIITFGKFKGKTIGEIADKQPSYILWLNDEKIVEFPEDMIEAIEWDEAENTPPESWFLPDLGCK